MSMTQCHFYELMAHKKAQTPGTQGYKDSVGFYDSLGLGNINSVAYQNWTGYTRETRETVPETLIKDTAKTVETRSCPGCGEKILQTYDPAGHHCSECFFMFDNDYFLFSEYGDFMVFKNPAIYEFLGR